MTSEPSADAITWACIGFRHDFGLLSDDDAQPVRTDALLWLQAWRVGFAPYTSSPAESGLGAGWHEPNAHVVDAACLDFDPGFRTRPFHEASAIRRAGVSWLQAWRHVFEDEARPTAADVRGIMAGLDDHPQRPVIREADEPIPRPEMIPEMIVVRDQAARRFVEAQIKDRPHIHCVAVSGGISALFGRTVARITVAGNVDLEADFCGEGSLRAILISRTRTWGDAATLVQLP